jgi:hypothetical protein
MRRMLWLAHNPKSLVSSNDHFKMKPENLDGGCAYAWWPSNEVVLLLPSMLAAIPRPCGIDGLGLWGTAMAGPGGQLAPFVGTAENRYRCRFANVLFQMYCDVAYLAQGVDRAPAHVVYLSL